MNNNFVQGGKETSQKRRWPCWIVEKKRSSDIDDRDGFRQREYKSESSGPHLSEVVQLSWHKGSVAGVLGLMAAGGEAEREEEDRSCEASAMLTFLFLEGKGCGKMASGKLTGRFKQGLTGRDLQGSPDPCFCSL